ncbi:hypothetical protein AURANDRAFT_70531 [Aureococcus anophagefferens]|uniref:Uncharacterized protein n=1 Tax=Aureococcus anophagefferens TaxID=44056 RepID=F0XVR1_AURAN|nr:hypothetical protein AURANDRAFT_70531 [Aureococcus anophagefferens]EGB13097.1 hypothetical protein AURANDRAFT_70531 [Aureococcus anophagefferens]|eukprot:XP_009032696.1 hypothetical protein AURANDRAFT_70531 [Aureococcus anophagefferens]
MRTRGALLLLALSFVGGLRPRERSLPSLAARLRGGESFWGPGDDDADAAHEESLPDHAPEDDDDDDDDEARAAKAAQRWTRRAFEAAHEGRSGAAASAFKRALRLTPGDAPYRAALLINAGSYLAFSGRSDDALPPLREAASLAPDEPRALHALGNALHQCDAPADALEVYARALHCAPSEDFPPNAPLLNNVATILLATGERDLATASLERSLEIEPHAPGTLFNLATAKYGAALDAAAVSSQRRVALATGGRARVRAAFSSGLYGEPSSAFRDVLDLLDAAEPHAPPGSPLRERVLALRACASNRVPGRAEHAAADFEDGPRALRCRAHVELGLALARDASALDEALDHLFLAAELGAGAPKMVEDDASAPRLEAHDDVRFARVVASLTHNDARAAVDALIRHVRAAADRAPAAPPPEPRPSGDDDF